MFIINCKNYEETAGDKVVKLAKIIKKVSKKHKIKIALAPPHHLLTKITDLSIPVLAQHVDNVHVGNTTGFIIPELLKTSKVAGSLINHSEHRIPNNDIKQLVSRLQKLKMISIVCVKNISEAQRYAKLNPNYIAIEPPELIGSGKAISKEKPELITKAATAVKNANNSTKMLCGAGIVSGEDVEKAIQLGAKGILVASGIIKSKNWEKIIIEFSKAMI